MRYHTDESASELAWALASADTLDAIAELFSHYRGGEPDNLPGPEEFMEAMERHPYADPKAVWTALSYRPAERNPD